MAVTRAPRTAVYRWSEGIDPFTREQMDSSHASIEELMAIDVQGTWAARPAAGVRGRYYSVADPGHPNDGVLYRDSGTAWARVSAPATRSIRVPHTFHVSGDVMVAAGDNFFVPPFFVPAPAGQTSKVVAARVQLNSGGTVTWRLTRLSGTTTTVLLGPQTTGVGGGVLTVPNGGVAVADLDQINLVVDAVASTPRNFVVTVLLDYTI